MQNDVKAFLDKYNLRTSETVRYVDLVSEVGELGKEILTGMDYGKVDYVQTPDAQGELGDCLFSLLALCCEMDVDAEAALGQALAKYAARFVAKGSIGS